MPMQAESLQVLESASVAPAQARAIVRAIEIEIAGLRGEMANLATKHELTKQGEDLRNEIANLRSELGNLRKEVGGVTRQMYVALLGQTTVMLGLFYFFLTQLR
jgi:hypothetical protein